MKIYHQQEDQPVFGQLVKSFPLGVGEAFGELMKMIPDGGQRPYYGISKMDKDGHVLYWAAAEEKFPGEAEKYGCERFTIPQGDYLSETVQNWKAKTDCIKDVFHELMQDKRSDNEKPCIEWYYKEEEMLCMLQADPVQELFAEVDEVMEELLNMVTPLSEAQLNAVPFKDSWTAAQLITHVMKSNNGITQALDMEGKAPVRLPTERVAELKKIFLDFDHKLTSPEFIVPKPGLYEKGKAIAALEKSNNLLTEKRTQVDLSTVIAFSAFGQITKLELLYFVLFHTTRHIHQLKNIIAHI